MAGPPKKNFLWLPLVNVKLNVNRFSGAETAEDEAVAGAGIGDTNGTGPRTKGNILTKEISLILLGSFFLFF